MDLSQYVTLGQYKDLEIKIDKMPVVDDEYIMSVINADLIYYGYADKITDRAVTREDTVKISFKGLLDGVAFEGGTGEQDNFTIYDGGGFIDGFAEGLIGAMPGVEVDVNVTFPEEYHSADLAGKAVVFKVTVQHIYEVKELTDALVDEATGGQIKTAAEFKESYKEFIETEAADKQAEQKYNLTWKTIYDGVTTIKMPEEIVNAMYDYEIAYYKDMADTYGMDLDMLLAYYQITRDSLKEDIENSVYRDLVIYSIIKAEGLTLTAEEYENFLKENEYSEEELLKWYTKKEIEDMVLATLTYDTVIEWQNFVEVEAE